jgi:hypothetical protein
LPGQASVYQKLPGKAQYKLLYDRKTESLWSQIMMEAVTGPLVGEKLEVINTMNTTWGEWKLLYPETQLLSEETGFNRDYSRDPYDGYQESSQLYFDVETSDSRYHPKEMVIGIEINDKYKAYPFSELAKVKNGKLTDIFQGRELQVIYSGENRSAVIKTMEGRELPSLVSFWFAWYAFHPETEVFEAE